MDAFDAPGRNSREWLLGPRGAELEPWAAAGPHLPDPDVSVAAVLCIPQTAPTIWMRDDAVDDLAVWDVVQLLVRAYDSGERDPAAWTTVLDGAGHLAVLTTA
ncbi:MAG: hypothetical protein Q8K58_02635 [Acidimicrobiales bacterium]|nr:hypothetical protein [Acidimicrobiales bacterium]